MENSKRGLDKQIRPSFDPRAEEILCSFGTDLSLFRNGDFSSFRCLWRIHQALCSNPILFSSNSIERLHDYQQFELFWVMSAQNVRIVND